MPSEPWKNMLPEDVELWVGASAITGGEDLIQCFEHAGIPIPYDADVRAIGAGIGRWSVLFDNYIGYDISPAGVEYAVSRGIDHRLMPPDPEDTWDWTIMTAVLYHNDADEREELMSHVHSRYLFCDIIPGNADWYGFPPFRQDNPEDFEAWLAGHGWKILSKGPYPEAGGRYAGIYYICERDD